MTKPDESCSVCGAAVEYDDWVGTDVAHFFLCPEHWSEMFNAYGPAASDDEARERIEENLTWEQTELFDSWSEQLGATS